MALMLQLSTRSPAQSASPWPASTSSRNRCVSVRASSNSSSSSSSGSSSSGSGSESLDKKTNKIQKSVGWFLDRVLHKTGTGVMRDIKGLWDMCDSCGNMMYTRSEDDLNKRICEVCGHHLRRSSTNRIDLLLDAGTWEPLDEHMIARDALKFRDQEEYATRLVDARKRSGLTDAVQTGLGKMNGIPVALGVMDFRFMGGSMGSVVGEKLTRLVERATSLALPLIIVCSSGGARMQEGTLSLMQMAKVSAALDVHQVQNGLLYIPILTNPTTGGITASFGMLGDVILAEPKAYIAFAGRRVIQQTLGLGKKLPDDFQTAEFALDHGLVDLIVPGNLLKGCLTEMFEIYAAAPLKKRKATTTTK